MSHAKALHRRTEIRKPLVALLLACCLAALASNARAGTLYEDLGGNDGVVGVVDQFLWNLADDEHVSHYFVETNLERFRSKLIEYICVKAEGPCTYTGDSMERTHAHMGVTVTDFNVTVEALIHAMESQHIPTGVQNRLLKVLAPDYATVVQE
ncbi:MAG: group 1 truncated hemoglobin [Pseudomonadota bacterium]